MVLPVSAVKRVSSFVLMSIATVRATSASSPLSILVSAATVPTINWVSVPVSVPIPIPFMAVAPALAHQSLTTLLQHCSAEHLR